MKLLSVIIKAIIVKLSIIIITITTILIAEVLTIIIKATIKIIIINRHFNLLNLNYSVAANTIVIAMILTAAMIMITT